MLGAESQLSFEVTGSVRRATVVGGDAYFTVARDPARPFTVSIDDVQVRVVGTQFEIRRRSGEVSVAVAEGTVDVSRTDAAAAAVRLHRGEALTARDSAQLTVRAVEPTDIAAWRSGRLVYDNAELSDVVRMRERGEDPDRGRLAGAVRAQHAEDRALGHVEVEPAQGVRLAEALVEADGLDHGAGHGRSSAVAVL